MARKYTDGSFVIQTTANISSQRQKAPTVDQIPFSLIPFTVKTATAQNVGPSPPRGDKAYIVAQRPNPRDFLFEVEKMNFAYREVTAATSATAADRVIGVDTTSGAVTVTLPTAASVRSGFVITIKDIGADTETNPITVARSGSDTIDGATSIILYAQYSAATLISNGSNAWRVI